MLIYVWAIEQDELSKRSIPTDGQAADAGQDVVVPWVLNTQNGPGNLTGADGPQVFNRYYHMFAQGELVGLVTDAARDMGYQLGDVSVAGEDHGSGIEIVQAGWERSNYYVELRRWER